MFIITILFPSPWRTSWHRVRVRSLDKSRLHDYYYFSSKKSSCLLQLNFKSWYHGWWLEIVSIVKKGDFQYDDKIMDWMYWRWHHWCTTKRSVGYPPSRFKDGWAPKLTNRQESDKTDELERLMAHVRSCSQDRHHVVPTIRCWLYHRRSMACLFVVSYTHFG